jgi:hypothetical protein
MNGRSVSLTGLLLVALSACGQDPIVLPVKNLDRPTDMAFVCMARVEQGAVSVVSGRPMSECRPPMAADPKVNLDARTKGTFGLLTNSARSELAAVDFDRNSVADIDPGNFGYNMLPVGALPESVAVSGDGCRAVTLNRGSCDFSYVDTGLMLKAIFPGTNASTELESFTAVASRRMRVSAANGPIASRPGEIQFLPTSNDLVFAGQNLCSELGAFTATGPVPYRAIVTYPSCSLVALVEFPSGRLLDSVRVTTTGISPVGTSPVCPVECNGPSGANVDAAASPLPTVNTDADADVADAGVSTPIVPGRDVLVSALAVLPDGSRAYVGGVNADSVFSIEVGTGSLVASPLGSAIPLHDGAAGVKRLRLSVDAYGTFVSSVSPLIPGAQYLYAIAGDASVRVIDIGRRAFSLREIECDTQVDSLYLSLPDPSARGLGCHELPDDLTAPRKPRRMFAAGPGIRLSSDPSGPLAEPIPVDVAFARVGVPGVKNNDNDGVDGGFAYVLYSNGEIAVINVDPTVRSGEQGGPIQGGGNATAHGRPILHQPRNAQVGVSDLSNDVILGPPQIVTEPKFSLTNSNLPLALRAKLENAQIPQLENTGIEFGYARFPRPDETRPQFWTFIWEGTLTGTERITATLKNVPTPAVSVDSAVGELTDVGAQFCGRGVLAGDVVRFFGCADDLACSEDGSSRCVKVNAAAPGMCFDGKSPADIEETCGRFISSRRRYRVIQAGPQSLALGLRLDEIARPTFAGCKQDSDCTGLDPEIYAGFKCIEMYAGQGKGCFAPCTAPGDDESCRLGFVCERIPGKAEPYCAEAPAFDTPNALECMRRTRAYNVSVGRAFLVTGQLTPRINTVQEQGGLCVESTARDTRLLNRIPFHASSCNFPEGIDSAQALRLGPLAMPGSTNPCIFEGPPSDGRQPVKALFQTPDMIAVMTNLEAPFGDGVVVTTSVRGGFVPTTFAQSNSNSIAVPTRLITSPIPVWLDTADNPTTFFPYLYMVDSGRASQGNRGQVLRANPRRMGLDSRYASETKDAFQVQ